MLNSVIICVIVGLIGVCVVFFFVAKHFYNKYKTTATEYDYLRNRYNALELNYKTLEQSIQAKKEVQNEKDQKLTEIANGSADDAIARLQNRNRKRSNKDSNSQLHVSG